MVLSIAHMSMVIFPIIFYIFHMSGVKKNVKNPKNILEPRLGYLISFEVVIWASRDQKVYPGIYGAQGGPALWRAPFGTLSS